MERVTITIDENLLHQIDDMVDDHYVKNRSHAIDLLLKKALATQAVGQAVVLAGGSAEKLALPSGKSIKPLLEVGGRSVIERILLHLKKYGVAKAVICLGVLGEGIAEKLKSSADVAGGPAVEYLWENGQGGSATGLLQAKPFIKDTFILCYSDVLYDELDLADMLRFHKANKAVCTLALANVREPKIYGVAKMRGSQITDFSEKPSATSSNLVNAGAAICEPEIFDFYESGVKSFERDLLPLVAKKEKLFGYVYSGPWFELGSQTQVDAAKKFYGAKK
jgi:NDP-sugar pyrophosphorylase family protein